MSAHRQLWAVRACGNCGACSACDERDQREWEHDEEQRDEPTPNDRPTA